MTGTDTRATAAGTTGPSTDTAARNKAVVRRVVAAMNSGDTGDCEQFIHPDYVNTERVEEHRGGQTARPGGADLRGPAEFRQTATWLRTVFGDLRYEIHNLLAEDDQVVLDSTMHGRHVAPFLEFPASGGIVANRQIHWFRLAPDGRVTEHAEVRDSLGLMQQLGVLPVTDGDPT